MWRRLSVFPLRVENPVQFFLLVIGEDLVLQEVVADPAPDFSDSSEPELLSVGVIVGVGLGQPVGEHDVVFLDPGARYILLLAQSWCLFLCTCAVTPTATDGVAWIIFPNPYAATRNQTHVSSVAPLWGTLNQDSLPTELSGLHLGFVL